MHGGTYNSNAMACAAVIAATAATGRPGFYEELLARGDRLAEGLVALAREAGFDDACHTGVGSMFQLWLGGPAPTDYRTGQALVAESPFPTFFAEMLEQCVIVQPPQEGLFLMSGAHTDDDVDRTLEAAAASMPAVARAAEEGRVGASGGVR